jgi:hypothetical protein
MNTCNIECRCPICGKSYTVIVPHEGFIKWRNGGRVQECMPQLSNEDREALMSGICDECWGRMYGEDD